MGMCSHILPVCRANDPPGSTAQRWKRHPTFALPARPDARRGRAAAALLERVLAALRHARYKPPQSQLPRLFPW